MPDDFNRPPLGETVGHLKCMDADRFPAWHERPTCDGLWLVYDDNRLLWPWRIREGEMRSIPAVVLCVYGPIPEPPS